MRETRSANPGFHLDAALRCLAGEKKAEARCEETRRGEGAKTAAGSAR